MHPVVDMIVYTVIIGVFFICATILAFFASTAIGTFVHGVSSKFIHRPMIYAFMVNSGYIVALTISFIPIPICIEMINFVAQ